MISTIIILAIIMLAAIILGLAEIFFFPGITVAGIGGILCAGGGLYYAYSLSSTVGNWTLFLSALFFVCGFLWFLRSRSFNRIALHTDVDSRLQSTQDLGLKRGDKGISMSRLAPIGKARFGEINVEAKSETGFIDENTPVVVVRVEGYNVIVDKINNPDKNKTV